LRLLLLLLHEKTDTGWRETIERAVRDS